MTLWVALVAEARGHSASVDVRVVNELAVPVTLSLCTSSCAADDLQERRTFAVGAETTVTVNCDPSFASAYAIQLPGGERCLLVSSRQSHAGAPLTSAKR